MPLYTTEELLDWIQERNRTVKVAINKTDLSHCEPWFYNKDSGMIQNDKGSFFRVAGYIGGTDEPVSQPVILQYEVGYLGIIRKTINGEPHYLMQAKIEPGNINCVQISPTIQATKSNFTQKHGGRKPDYLDYFINSGKYKIIADSIQSEQSSRFYKKRNRNIIIEVDDEIDVLPTHRFMTIDQIKALMRYDNLVNMDTRTVLSCLPLWEDEYAPLFSDEATLASVRRRRPEEIRMIYNRLNDQKMFREDGGAIVPLYSLENWRMKDGAFSCIEPYSFRVVFCDIEIEGREVRRWKQPLFEAAGIAVFGLLTRVKNGVREFLVKATREVGCFDVVELGPSVQREYVSSVPENEVDRAFDRILKTKTGIKFDVLLSEEGGRFYHEQNRNVIAELPEGALENPPDGYFWVGLRTLCELTQTGNFLNIQLRNLLSVLEW